MARSNTFTGLTHIAPALLLFLLTGCNLPFVAADVAMKLSAPFEQKNFNVLVIDGDTGEPIASATVVALEHDGAGGSIAHTDAHGRARIRANMYFGPSHADAPGYLPGSKFTGWVAKHGHDVTLALYRAPAPISGLSFPIRFRGLAAVDTDLGYRRRRCAPSKPHQREFFTRVESDSVTVLPLLPIPAQSRKPVKVLAARFEDGTPLRYENAPVGACRRDANDVAAHEFRDRVPLRADGVAMFQLGGRGSPAGYHQLYFVGTKAEARAAQEALVAGATSDPATRRRVGGYVFLRTPID